MVNLCLKSYCTLLPLFYHLHVWTWIRIGNADPDAQSSWIWIQYGSGSTTLFASIAWMVVGAIRDHLSGFGGSHVVWLHHVGSSGLLTGNNYTDFWTWMAWRINLVPGGGDFGSLISFFFSIFVLASSIKFLRIFLVSGVGFPLYPEVFYIMNQWSCSASGSFWEMLDSNPGPLPRCLVCCQWATTSQIISIMYFRESMWKCQFLAPFFLTYSVSNSLFSLSLPMFLLF